MRHKVRHPHQRSRSSLPLLRVPVGIPMVPPWVYTHCHDDAPIVKSYPYALESRAGLSVLHTHQRNKCGKGPGQLDEKSVTSDWRICLARDAQSTTFWPTRRLRYNDHDHDYDERVSIVNIVKLLPHTSRRGFPRSQRRCLQLPVEVPG